MKISHLFPPLNPSPLHRQEFLCPLVLPLQLQFRFLVPYKRPLHVLYRRAEHLDADQVGPPAFPGVGELVTPRWENWLPRQAEL